MQLPRPLRCEMRSWKSKESCVKNCSTNSGWVQTQMVYETELQAHGYTQFNPTEHSAVFPQLSCCFEILIFASMSKAGEYC